MIYLCFMKKNLNQGKRKEQIDFSEQIVTYGILGILIVIIYIVVTNALENL